MQVLDNANNHVGYLPWRQTARRLALLSHGLGGHDHDQDEAHWDRHRYQGEEKRRKIDRSRKGREMGWQMSRE